eukprot:6180357-Pleurochrysis_carterae.AAC.1
MNDAGSITTRLQSAGIFPRVSSACVARTPITSDSVCEEGAPGVRTADAQLLKVALERFLQLGAHLWRRLVAAACCDKRRQGGAKGVWRWWREWRQNGVGGAAAAGAAVLE